MSKFGMKSSWHGSCHNMVRPQHNNFGDQGARGMWKRSKWDSGPTIDLARKYNGGSQPQGIANNSRCQFLTCASCIRKCQTPSLLMWIRRCCKFITWIRWTVSALPAYSPFPSPILIFLIITQPKTLLRPQRLVPPCILIRWNAWSTSFMPPVSRLLIGM